MSENIRLTKEDFERAFNSDNPELVAAGEFFMGKCRYPKNYWVMPDYYYPGVLGNINKKRSDFLTSNNLILERLGFFKDDTKDDSYTGTFEKSGKSIKSIRFTDDEKILLEDIDGNNIEIPFDLLCGLLLKAREKQYKRPDILDYAGPINKKRKQQWMKNQESVMKLQEKGLDE